MIYYLCFSLPATDEKNSPVIGYRLVSNSIDTIEPIKNFIIKRFNFTDDDIDLSFDFGIKLDLSKFEGYTIATQIEGSTRLGLPYFDIVNEQYLKNKGNLFDKVIVFHRVIN